MQILGTGIDIVENIRIKKSLKNKNFINRIFSASEILFSKCSDFLLETYDISNSYFLIFSVKLRFKSCLASSNSSFSISNS